MRLCQVGTLASAVGLASLVVGHWSGKAAEQTRAKQAVTAPAEERGFYTSAELAEIHQTSQRNITYWASNGKIEGAYKHGRQWRFDPEYRLDL